MLTLHARANSVFSSMLGVCAPLLVCCDDRGVWLSTSVFMFMFLFVLVLVFVLSYISLSRRVTSGVRPSGSWPRGRRESSNLVRKYCVIPRRKRAYGSSGREVFL